MATLAHVGMPFAEETTRLGIFFLHAADEIIASHGNMHRTIMSDCQEVYARIFTGGATVYVKFYDYTLQESGDIFYAVGRERGHLERDAQQLELAIRTSRVFRKHDDRWRGRPLTDYRTVVDLIAATTTHTGLTVKARLDQRHYATGITVSAEEMKELNLHPHAFYGEWNYTIRPI